MWFYKFISYIFHPVFLPFYGCVLYFSVFPHQENEFQVRYLLIFLFSATIILPIIFLSILKYFKLIQNYQIPNINERRLPLLFYFFLCFLIAKYFSAYRLLPDLTIMFIGITFITLVAYILISLKFKISLHAISIGGIIGVVLSLSKIYAMNLMMLISTLFMIAGIILSARLALKAHNQLEVYFGFIAGIAIQYGIYVYYSI